jgi:hypothetical protein
MKPAFWAVIGALLKPLPVGEGLDTIRLSIGYESGFGGRKRHLELPIKVRVGIPVWLLIFGAGLIACAVYSGKIAATKSETSGLRRLYAFPVGCFAEAIALVLVALNTKVVILGMELDPKQVLPCVILSVIAGVIGPDAFRILKALGVKTDGA